MNTPSAASDEALKQAALRRAAALRREALDAALDAMLALPARIVLRLRAALGAQRRGHA